MGAIFRKEINSYFTSGIAYVVLAAMTFFAGYFFMGYCLFGDSANMTYVFMSMFTVITLVMPILTMKLFSEEKRQKTDQGILTAPINLLQIVLGKYLSAVAVYAISLVIFILEALVLATFTTPDWSAFISNFIGIFLLGCAMIAISLLISSLTESQVVAAVTGIAAGLVISMIDTLAAAVESIPLLPNILSAISFTGPYQNFTVGIISLSSVVFFLSICVIFIFLTVRVLEKRRWG